MWRALSVKDSSITAELEKYRNVCDAFVLDNGKGGTGEQFDWEIINGLTDKYTIFLAGGLYPENIKNAIEGVRPFGVDTSSRVS